MSFGKRLFTFTIVCFSLYLEMIQGKEIGEPFGASSEWITEEDVDRALDLEDIDEKEGEILLKSSQGLKHQGFEDIGSISKTEGELWLGTNSPPLSNLLCLKLRHLGKFFSMGIAAEGEPGPEDSIMKKSKSMQPNTAREFSIASAYASYEDRRCHLSQAILGNYEMSFAQSLVFDRSSMRGDSLFPQDAVFFHSGSTMRVRMKGAAVRMDYGKSELIAGYSQALDEEISLSHLGIQLPFNSRVGFSAVHSCRNQAGDASVPAGGVVTPLNELKIFGIDSEISYRGANLALEAGHLNGLGSALYLISVKDFGLAKVKASYRYYDPDYLNPYCRSYKFLRNGKPAPGSSGFNLDLAHTFNSRFRANLNYDRSSFESLLKVKSVWSLSGNARCYFSEVFREGTQSPSASGGWYRIGTGIKMGKFENRLEWVSSPSLLFETIFRVSRSLSLRLRLNDSQTAGPGSGNRSALLEVRNSVRSKWEIRAQWRSKITGAKGGYQSANTLTAQLRFIW